MIVTASVTFTLTATMPGTVKFKITVIAGSRCGSHRDIDGGSSSESDKDSDSDRGNGCRLMMMTANAWPAVLYARIAGHQPSTTTVRVTMTATSHCDSDRLMMTVNAETSFDVCPHRWPSRPPFCRQWRRGHV